MHPCLDYPKAMEQLRLFHTRILTVIEINRYLKVLFESDEILRDVWISGEISNLAQPSSGHIYFTLKDASAALKCVIWKGSALKLRMNLLPGMAVEAHGAVGVYERDGQYQLYVDAIRFAGEGALYQEFLRIKAKLEAEGLFDESRKRSIPEQPNVIGVITSRTGAALQDILNTLKARFPMVRVVLAPAAVQGEQAPAEIVTAIETLNRVIHPDVIILARGGGSLEDLMAFNDESVVRAISSSQAPLICGVGHETDFTLADFAADWRAPTPTGAAVKAVPDMVDYEKRLSVLTENLYVLMQAMVEDRRVNLLEYENLLARSSPRMQIHNNMQTLDGLSVRLSRSMEQYLRLKKTQDVNLEKRLFSLNPQSILDRGFALVSDMEGGIIGSVRLVSSGKNIRVRVSDGVFGATVAESEQ
jgi:exodeoxyribonuclease VII large subunit